MCYGNTVAVTVATLVSWIATGVPVACASGFDLSGDVRLVSDYVDRGVSQTMSRPALQGTLVLDHETGWYTYAWASNVDFTESGAETDGANIEVNIGLGYVYEVGDRTALILERTEYAYPGTRHGIDYDYAEWHACLTIDETHALTIAYSDNVFGSGDVGLLYTARTGGDLTDRIAIELELGYYDLRRAFGAAYSHAGIALKGTVEAFDWRLGYLITGGDAPDLFPESTVSDRFILELGLAF